MDRGKLFVGFAACTKMHHRAHEVHQSDRFSGGSTLFSVCKICALIYSPVFLDIMTKLGQQKDVIVTLKKSFDGMGLLWGVFGG